MRRELERAARAAGRFLDSLDERPVWPAAEAVARLAELDTELPNEPAEPEAILETLDRVGSPAAVASAGGRYFGFVIGGALPATVAAHWLATAWDQNAGAWVASPIASVVEAVALRWLLDVLRLPAGCGGAFVTGATMANFTALAAARQAALERAGWNVEADGLIGAPPITIVVSEEAHPSVTKSLGLLGLGRSRALRVPTDAQGRMRAEALPKLDGPAIVCAQAGNVNTGSFDPLGEIAEAAHAQGAWVHVDGAFGLWAAASPEKAHLVAGAEQADSWATDAHKWLNVPYDSGLAFVREPERLSRAMAISAAYLPGPSEHRDPLQYTPELSRRARGIEVWAALRSLGRRGLAELIERNCRQARRFAEGLEEAGFEVLNEVVLNQVLVSFGEAERTRQAIRRIQEDGTCWCGETTWRGRVAMRISVSSWATTEEDVERSVRAMVAAGEAA